MGVSFAIPIDVAMNVEQQLVAHGKVTRGKLGATVQDVNQGLAESFGLERPAGALVSSVEPDGRPRRRGCARATSSSNWTGKSSRALRSFRPRSRT